MKKRYASLILSAIICISAALFLRFAHGYAIREAITSWLGFDWRTVVEHFFDGVGIPLAFAVSFVAVWLILEWLRYVAAGNFAARRIWQSRHPYGVVPASAAVHVAAVLGVAYVIGSFLFEEYQSHRSVYGNPARAYFHGWQFGADVAGACPAFTLAFLYDRCRNVA
jgi:hypothetical protein